ncbi:protein AGENET DOMAIN (AGD)-CONTAINING P1-like [Solanum lycopersicum]|uniref:Agenet domain-containing protein n=1 Tax=Solanum lycopersicum TaxID=4081 RepID=A0A3Q7HV15_SOLLC|nr:DUF724 domain-containing protein 3-like [Solanum lycopersicum]
MARTKVKVNKQQYHKSRMAEISRSIQSKKQIITKVFEKGDEVEVGSHEDGFEGSYYRATILSMFDPNHYIVKYKTLSTDDESELLEEVIPTIEVRPVPPHRDGTMSEHGFRLYDIVDVYANDGWWFGCISAIIGEEYYVYFPSTEDSIAYPSHVLRFHQEWSKCGWISLMSS